jgi:hypothetical protein
MLASDLGYLYQRPYGPFIPSALIMVTVAALNWLADAVRDTSGDQGRARIEASGAGDRFAVFRFPPRGAAARTPESADRKEPAGVQ